MKAALGSSSSAFADSPWRDRPDAELEMVQPGGFSITGRTDQVIGTLLGSCVAACICDFRTGIGGLNHFLLPDDGLGAGTSDGQATRYGVQAMELLINGILKRGGRKSNMRAKLFGGANVRGFKASHGVGKRNQEFAVAFLNREGIEVTASDLGGESARRIFFRPSTSKVWVQTTGLGNMGQIRAAEDELRLRAISTTAGGEVELF